jgi:hypothetical protein
MPDQKKFASYAAIAIGSVGLIASITALKYCPSLPPLIAGDDWLYAPASCVYACWRFIAYR